MRAWRRSDVATGPTSTSSSARSSPSAARPMPRAAVAVAVRYPGPPRSSCTTTPRRSWSRTSGAESTGRPGALRAARRDVEFKIGTIDDAQRGHPVGATVTALLGAHAIRGAEVPRVRADPSPPLLAIRGKKFAGGGCRRRKRHGVANQKQQRTNTRQMDHHHHSPGRRAQHDDRAAADVARLAISAARSAAEAARSAEAEALDAVSYADYFTDECLGCESGAEHGHRVLHPATGMRVYHPYCACIACATNPARFD